MNRELKFRVWDIKNKLFCKNYGISLKDDISLVPIIDGDYVIQQYTGLKDKNGKEIYEGDIFKKINQELVLEEVKWQDGGFVVGDINDWHILTSGRINIIGYEIVGNIFEIKYNQMT